MSSNIQMKHLMLPSAVHRRAALPLSGDIYHNSTQISKPMSDEL